MNAIKQISLLVFLMGTVVTTAQVVFNADASKTEIGLNEKVQVSFTMNKDNGEFTPPDFTNFEVISGPLTSTNTSFKDGRPSYEKSIAFTLKPKKRGTLIIEGGTLEISGNTYSSNSVSIEVVRKRKKNYLIDKDSLANKIFLKLEYPKGTLFVRDSIVVQYKLYVAQDISVNSWKLLEDSKIKNAEVIDMSPKEISVVQEDVDGTIYRSVILKSLRLKPSKQGKLIISPLELEVSVGIPSGRRSFNVKNIQDPKVIVVSSEKVKVEVN